MEISYETGVLLVALAVGFYALKGIAGNKTKSKAPPSLPKIPILGSLPFLSGLSNLHLCLTEKCKTYGKIYSLYVGSRYIVVLNGHELIREALVKHSLEYSGRGEVYVEKYVWPDHGKGIIVSQASDTQRRARSSCLAVLKSFGFGSRAVMEHRVREEAEYLIQHIRSLGGVACYPGPILERATLNVIYKLMFNKRFPQDDKMGQELTADCHQIVDSTDVAYDVFPILTRLPSRKRKLDESVKAYNRYMKFCESHVEESMNAKGGDDNFVREYMQLEGNKDVSKRELAVIIRDLIIAGSESTSGQLNWAMILLANHPDIQIRLRKEIDSVVPQDRLPSLDDKIRLPFVEAVMLEVFRLKTVAPLAMPRMTLERTVVGGYDIPAGTEVIANLWSAHMDPDVWIRPEEFNPERFLDETGGAVVNRELMITFSYGKRSCLGEILARQEMFLFLSALVQQFYILPPEGEKKVKDDMQFFRTLTAVKHTMRIMPRV